MFACSDQRASSIEYDVNILKAQSKSLEVVIRRQLETLKRVRDEGNALVLSDSTQRQHLEVSIIGGFTDNFIVTAIKENIPIGFMNVIKLISTTEPLHEMKIDCGMDLKDRVLIYTIYSGSDRWSDGMEGISQRLRFRDHGLVILLVVKTTTWDRTVYPVRDYEQFGISNTWSLAAKDHKLTGLVDNEHNNDSLKEIMHFIRKFWVSHGLATSKSTLSPQEMIYLENDIRTLEKFPFTK